MSAPERSSSRVRKATVLLTYPANNGGGGVAASKKKHAVERHDDVAETPTPTLAEAVSGTRSMIARNSSLLSPGALEHVTGVSRYPRRARTVNNGGAAAATASRKKQKQEQAATTSPSVDTNSSSHDNIIIVDDKVVCTYVKEKDDCHETELAANDQDQVEDDAGGDVFYALKRPYRAGSNAIQQSQMFVKPSTENRVAVPIDSSGKRYHILDECNIVDGLTCEVRTKRGFADLPKVVQVRIGSFGQAKQFIVYGELVPGSKIYEAIHFARMLQGSKNRSKKDSRDPDCTLFEFVGGYYNDLIFKDGQTAIYHRVDKEGRTIFKIEPFDWKKQDRDEIKKTVEQNTHIRDACLARKDEVDKMRHEHGVYVTSQSRGHMYEITEVDDDGRVKGRVKAAKSVTTVRNITGKQLGQVVVVNQGILPAKMNQEVEIKTSRGTFRVKRVSETRFKEIASKK
ncbi:hypothetical protein ACHAWC_010102 [Mediolabrus comicus]